MMTAVTIEHTSWCVRKHDRGACSGKRGKWDRSTNTWSSDMTQKDREAIRDALRLWHDGIISAEEAALFVRRNGETLTGIDNYAILTWNMTQKRLAKKGTSWPI